MFNKVFFEVVITDDRYKKFTSKKLFNPYHLGCEVAKIVILCRDALQRDTPAVSASPAAETKSEDTLVSNANANVVYDTLFDFRKGQLLAKSIAYEHDDDESSNTPPYYLSKVDSGVGEILKNIVRHINVCYIIYLMIRRTALKSLPEIKKEEFKRKLLEWYTVKEANSANINLHPTQNDKKCLFYGNGSGDCSYKEIDNIIESIKPFLNTLEQTWVK